MPIDLSKIFFCTEGVLGIECLFLLHEILIGEESNCCRKLSSRLTDWLVCLIATPSAFYRTLE
jgi:hypothetical protein